MEEIKEGSAQLVDCREKWEWDAGHLHHASFCPLSELVMGSLPADVQPDQKIYVHCKAGVRVHKAAPLMRQLGCESVIPIQEGFVDLVNLGMPLAGYDD